MSTASSSSTAAGSAAAAAAARGAGALIFLHGLGDTPAGWSSLSKQLPSIKPSLANIQYVFPPAPTIPISINGGMRMSGWFDLYDWPIAVGCQHDHDGLGRAVQVIQQSVHELELQGIPKNRIVVGGFSQGGAVALRTVYHDQCREEEKDKGTTATPKKQQQEPNEHDQSSSGQYAACVNLSGWLTFDQLSNEHCKMVPLFWGHGSFDDKVLFEQQRHGVDKLVNDMNLKEVHDHSYPVGHGAHPEEMIMLAEFLDQVLFGNKSSSHDTTSASTNTEDKK